MLSAACGEWITLGDFQECAGSSLLSHAWIPEALWVFGRGGMNTTFHLDIDWSCFELLS